jgi:hypothetical protein
MGFKYKNPDKDATLPVILQPVKNLINLILAFHSLKEKIFQTNVFRMTRKNEPTKILEYYHDRFNHSIHERKIPFFTFPSIFQKTLKEKTFHRLKFSKKARNLQPKAYEKSNFYLNFLLSILKSFLLILLLTAFSCGVKGNPKPPPTITPKSVEDLTIKQYDGKFLIYFNYSPLYTDDRPMKEDFKFIIYKNSKKFDVSLFKKDNTYWLFDSIESKETCYQVQVKTKHKESTLSKPVCIVGKAINIEKPKPLLISIVEDGLKLTIPENGTFNIYKVKDESDFYLIPYKKVIKEKEFIDTNVELDKRYCYYYTALIDDVESEKSDTVCQTFKDIFPPLPPENGKLIVDKNEATIIFEPSKSKDVVGYIFYKNSKIINNTPIKTYYFIDNDYKPGDVYYVEAVDKAGNKSQKLEIKE